MVVPANNTEPSQEWAIYMASPYATAINECVQNDQFDWKEVQMGENILTRCEEALQVSFMDIINEQVRAGIYCSSDWIAEGHQGAGKGDDVPKMDDSELNDKPRSLHVLGRKHPFVSTNDSRKALVMLSAMIRIGEIQVIGKAGVGVIVTKAFHTLVRTIQQCDAAILSLTRPIRWNAIAMDGQDLENLAHTTLQCLTSGSHFVCLFEGPGKVGTTPIADLTMEDQQNVPGVKTVCVLDPQDARFQVGSWGFQAIQYLVSKGSLHAQVDCGEQQVDLAQGVACTQP